MGLTSFIFWLSVVFLLIGYKIVLFGCSQTFVHFGMSYKVTIVWVSWYVCELITYRLSLFESSLECFLITFTFLFIVMHGNGILFMYLGEYLIHSWGRAESLKLFKGLAIFSLQVFLIGIQIIALFFQGLLYFGIQVGYCPGGNWYHLYGRRNLLMSFSLIM